MIPEEIKNRMMDCQEEQGNPRDWRVFKKKSDASDNGGGFDWGETLEGYGFWMEVIHYGNYPKFYERYPKQPKEEPLTFPRKMLVWGGDEGYRSERIVLCKNGNLYVTVGQGSVDDFDNGVSFRSVQWENAKEIPKSIVSTSRINKINSSYLLGGYQKTDKK